jgi:hypothetical protein
MPAAAYEQPYRTRNKENQMQSIATPRDQMASIQGTARLAAVLYLLIALLAGFVHLYVPGALIVPGDAGATASNIRASEGLFRAGIGVELLLLLSEVALSVLLYVLLRPVDKTLSLIAAASRLVMTTIHGLNVLGHVAVLLLLSGAGYLTAFAPNQIDALVMASLDAYSYGFSIGIVFLVLHAFPLGYLIYRSGYFPKALGVLFMVAALGYLTDGLSHVLVPGYVKGAPYIALPIALSEIAFPLWLLFKGVNAEQWGRRTSAEPAGRLVAAAAGGAL